jgi:hypothetical protein
MCADREGELIGFCVEQAKGSSMNYLGILPITRTDPGCWMVPKS